MATRMIKRTLLIRRSCDRHSSTLVKCARYPHGRLKTHAIESLADPVDRH